MKQNGRPETRIVYGERCTWWGPIQDAFTPTDSLHHREVLPNQPSPPPNKIGVLATRKLKPYVPVCPNCYGPLMQVPTEEDFFIAVHNYENGFGPKRKRIKKHPGYVEFMKWLKRRCFATVPEAATVYKEQTGREVVLDLTEFQ